MCISAPNSRRYVVPVDLLGAAAAASNGRTSGHLSSCDVAVQSSRAIVNGELPYRSNSQHCNTIANVTNNNFPSNLALIKSAPSRSSDFVAAPTPNATTRVLTNNIVGLSTPAPKRKRRRRAPQPPGKTATDKKRLFVKHNYHDLALEPDLPQGKPKNGSNDDETQRKTRAPLSLDSFPMKLYRLLDQIESDGLGKIVSWQPHGRAFVIRDPALFVQIVMPRYFPKVNKFTSLQRQFNLYGFERLTREGPDDGAYYHECFLRGRPGLSAQRMLRKRVKGTGYKASSNPADEPDFYLMPFVSEVARKNPHLFDNAVTNVDGALSVGRANQQNLRDSFRGTYQPSRKQFGVNQFGMTVEDPGNATESTQDSSVVTGVSSQFTSVSCQHQRNSVSSGSIGSEGSWFCREVGENNYFFANPNLLSLQGSTSTNFSFPSTVTVPQPAVPLGESFLFNVEPDPIAPLPLASSNQVLQSSLGVEDHSILMEFLKSL